MTALLLSTRVPAPMVTRLVDTGPILVKSEAAQWTGSAKYRMVYSKVMAALRSRRITEGTTLAEVTSGSTGIALAHVGHLLGLPIELHTYESISPQKREKIGEIGGKLVLYPDSTPMSAILGGVRERAAADDYWHLDQYDRASTLASYQDFARELVAQLQDRKGPPPQMFLCPVGTGGLIQSLGAALRQAFPGIRVIALEPEKGASIDGIRNTELSHLGPADPYDVGFPDDVIRVPSPRGSIWAAGVAFGLSATAAYLLAVAKGWTRTIVLAPD